MCPLLTGSQTPSQQPGWQVTRIAPSAEWVRPSSGTCTLLSIIAVSSTPGAQSQVLEVTHQLHHSPDSGWLAHNNPSYLQQDCQWSQTDSSEWDRGGLNPISQRTGAVHKDEGYDDDIQVEETGNDGLRGLTLWHCWRSVPSMVSQFGRQRCDNGKSTVSNHSPQFPPLQLTVIREQFHCCGEHVRNLHHYLESTVKYLSSFFKIKPSLDRICCYNFKDLCFKMKTLPPFRWGNYSCNTHKGECVCVPHIGVDDLHWRSLILA